MSSLIWNFPPDMPPMLTEAAAMHLRVFEDKDGSGHLDIVGDGTRPWTVDLIAVALASMLVLGFVCALAAHVFGLPLPILYGA